MSLFLLRRPGPRGIASGLVFFLFALNIFGAGTSLFWGFWAAAVGRGVLVGVGGVWRGDWVLGYHYMDFRHFPNIS